MDLTRLESRPALRSRKAVSTVSLMNTTVQTLRIDGKGRYEPASLPPTLEPPRRLPVATGALEGAKPSVLRLAVWVDVLSTGFRGGRGGSSPSMSLPVTGC